MYVFIAPSGKHDRRTRDVIGISFVRLAQQGNMLAQQELMGLLKFTIDNWIERYSFLARWQGHEDEIQNQLEACIRRYRYTGSFVNYVFRTLECAGRGIRPTRMSSADHSSELWDFLTGKEDTTTANVAHGIGCHRGLASSTDRLVPSDCRFEPLES
jgi:hypothetical protein